MKYRGALLIALIVAGLGSVTCSLQHETGATGAAASIADRYVTAWPPANWVFFMLGVTAFAGALWIMIGSTPNSGGPK